MRIIMELKWEGAEGLNSTLYNKERIWAFRRCLIVLCHLFSLSYSLLISIYIYILWFLFLQWLCSKCFYLLGLLSMILYYTILFTNDILLGNVIQHSMQVKIGTACIRCSTTVSITECSTRFSDFLTFSISVHWNRFSLARILTYRVMNSHPLSPVISLLLSIFVADHPLHLFCWSKLAERTVWNHAFY